MAFHLDSYFYILRTIVSGKSMILQKSKKSAYRICCLSLTRCPTQPAKVSNSDWLSVISRDPSMSIGFCHFVLRASKSSSCPTEDMAGVAEWPGPSAAQESDPHESASSWSQGNPETPVLPQPCSGAGTQKPQPHIWGGSMGSGTVDHPPKLPAS